MTDDRAPQPPRLASWLLRRILPRDGTAASIAGDLLEEYRADIGARSHTAAACRYWRHALSIAVRYSLTRRRARPAAEGESSGRRRSMVTDVRADLRYACRSIAKSPGFAAVTILTLAVGVGANTAIFSVLHAVVLRDLPYHHPDRLALLWTLNLRQNLTDGSSYLNVRDWKDQSRELESMAVYRDVFPRATLTAGEQPERIQLALVGPGFFQVLGAPPLLGRTLESPDFDAGRRAAVISHSLWRQRFAGDAAIVGRSIEIDGTPWDVVGVMAPDFEFPTRDIHVWQPISVLPIWRGLQNNPETRSGDLLMVVGRLTPAATVSSARAELDTIAARLRTAYPDSNGGRGILLTPLTDHIIGSRTGRSLWLLFGSVGLVVLIACANVANLALARGASRRGEFSLRTALGASRTRLVRQALTENLVLSGLAASAGLLFAWLATTALKAWTASALPRLGDAHLDATVLSFGVSLSLTCGLVAGLLPALKCSAINPVEALRDAGLRLSGARGSRRVRHALVVVELALAVILLAGAGLLIRSFVRLQAVDRGFDSRHVLLMQVDLPRKYDGQAAKAEYFRDAFERIRTLPGVAAAGAISDLFIERTPDLRVTLEGQPPRRADDPAPPLIRDRIIPGYFEAMRIPLLHGRFLQDSDLVPDIDAQQPDAVVINEAMARRFWPGENPVGKRLKYGPNPGPTVPWTRVVGVVADMKRQNLDDAAVPCIFWPGFGPQMDVVVRTVGDPELLKYAIRAALHSVDPTTPPYGIVAIEQHLGDTVAILTLQTLLLSALAAAALVLAVIGVYGVVHQTVVSRAQEIGVRMALGASQPSVLRMILSRAIALSTAGLALGIAGALALGRSVSSFLYETSPIDPLTFAAVAGLLLAVTTLACLAPARRAARVDPIAALRAE